MLSFAQQRLWFIDQLGEGSVQYNMPATFTLTGIFDQAAFEKALGRIIERHEVLRTHFVSAGDEPVQVIKAKVDLPLSTVDLTHLTGQAQIEEVARLAQ